MTTLLLFISHFTSKLPPNTTIHNMFTAKNNCSPGFVEYIGVCFFNTNFSLCIIQKSYQGKTSPKGCLLPQSLLLPSFITWSCHDKLATLCSSDCEYPLPAWSMTTAKHLGCSYFFAPGALLQDHCRTS